MPMDHENERRRTKREPGGSEVFATKRFFEEPESGLFDFPTVKKPRKNARPGSLRSLREDVKELGSTEGGRPGNSDLELVFKEVDRQSSVAPRPSSPRTRRTVCFNMIGIGACLALVAFVFANANASMGTVYRMLSAVTSLSSPDFIAEGPGALRNDTLVSAVVHSIREIFQSAEEEHVKRVADAVVHAVYRPAEPRPVTLFDFALYTNGARVIREMTTLGSRPSIIEVLSAFPFGRIQVGRKPSTALKEGLEEGDCWFINGTSGILGIQLSNTIVVQNVTIDHVERVSAFDISSAPRSMRLWGVLEGPEVASNDVLKLSDTSKLLEKYNLPKSRKQTIVLLSEFQYDIQGASTSQTFSSFPDTLFGTRALAFRKVLLEIQGNWGSSESTCLYRVRVHGRREGQIIVGD